MKIGHLSGRWSLPRHTPCPATCMLLTVNTRVPPGRASPHAMHLRDIAYQIEHAVKALPKATLEAIND